jgi:hypothetical protein
MKQYYRNGMGTIYGQVIPGPMRRGTSSLVEYDLTDGSIIYPTIPIVGGGGLTPTNQPPIINTATDIPVVGPGGAIGPVIQPGTQTSVPVPGVATMPGFLQGTVTLPVFGEVSKVFVFGVVAVAVLILMGKK